MNMPFEPGLDFGCKNFGCGPFDQKRIPVPEERQCRYQAALSDLAGNDIESHEGNHTTAIRKVRNWVVELGVSENVGAAAKVASEYEDFQGWHFDRVHKSGFSEDDIADYPPGELIDAMTDWVSLGVSRT